MAAPKKDPCAIWTGSKKPKLVRESGKTADQRKPVGERESVRRALLRLPEEHRRSYAVSIGAGIGLTALLNRVEGLRLAPSDGHAIAVERINGESLTKVRRRRKRVA